MVVINTMQNALSVINTRSCYCSTLKCIWCYLSKGCCSFFS
uniref:Uncharacterized protein n=1 Tax=Rhizophora mucronata TaxID=61149 RepID=A0A2P2QGT8_RHIMU